MSVWCLVYYVFKDYIEKAYESLLSEIDIKQLYWIKLVKNPIWIPTRT